MKWGIFKMTSLYDKDYRYTEWATILGEQTENALTDIFTNFVDEGFSPREIAHIMCATVAQLELMEVI